MQEIIELIIDFLFIEAIGVLFVLAGVYGWQEPRIFRGESWKDSGKDWVRAIKVIVGATLMIIGIYGGIYRCMR